MKLRLATFGSILCLLAAPAAAEVVYDFDGVDPLDVPEVSGDKVNFAVSTDQARSASQSLRFVDPAPEPFESFTYDIPFDITAGVISVYFYDARGASGVNFNPALAKWGGSIILEDADNPSDFGAVEICEFSYGGPGYYATESVDRLITGDMFESNSLPARSVGWHKVEFMVGATTTAIRVDGQESDEVAAPGGQGRNLRLRIMADSASDGSNGNWTTSTNTVSKLSPLEWVSYDTIEISATAPAVNSHTMGFEIVGEDPEYDSAGEFMVSTAFDNPNMSGFVNQWGSVEVGAAAQAGTRVGKFTNPPAPFKSIVWDVSAANSETTATVWFYDALGNDETRDKTGGSIIIENGNNPAEFLAVEIWNFDYPVSGDPTPGGFNYYLTQGIPGSPNGGALHSRELGNRSVGWHRVDIGLYDTYSIIAVDGIIDSGMNGIVTGPGLDKNLKLRIMGDSATSGGFNNYTDVNELLATYLQTTDPYVYYDDVTLPLGGPSSVNDWTLYE